MNQIIKSEWFIAISSAMVSAFIGYLVGMRKEKMVLKQKLETETVDMLLNLIVTASEKLISIDTVFFGNPFISYYDFYREREDLINNFHYELAKDNVDRFAQNSQEYFYSAIQVIRFSENRSIILNNGFKIFIDKIIELHSELRSQCNFISEELCRFVILRQMRNGEKISSTYLDDMKLQLKQIEDTKALLQCLFVDFSSELQNEFIGKYYTHKRKIKPRKPQDTQYKVVYKDTQVKW